MHGREEREVNTMAAYEGLVASLKGNGRAEVIIQPGSSGIPGVSREVNSRVCHCTTDGSTITIDVENRAGAEVGDWAVVDREKGALKRNVATLLGIPALGTVVGVLVALIVTAGFSFGTTAWIVCLLGGLFIGIVIGITIFRRVSAGSRPFISRVVRTRLEMASMPLGQQCPTKKKDGTCGTCSGFF
jgi:uncharacterized protein YacL